MFRKIIIQFFLQYGLSGSSSVKNSSKAPTDSPGLRSTSDAPGRIFYVYTTGTGYNGGTQVMDAWRMDAQSINVPSDVRLEVHHFDIPDNNQRLQEVHDRSVLAQKTTFHDKFFGSEEADALRGKPHVILDYAHIFQYAAPGTLEMNDVTYPSGEIFDTTGLKATYPMAFENRPNTALLKIDSALKVETWQDRAYKIFGSSNHNRNPAQELCFYESSEESKVSQWVRLWNKEAKRMGLEDDLSRRLDLTDKTSPIQKIWDIQDLAEAKDETFNIWKTGPFSANSDLEAHRVRFCGLVGRLFLRN